MNKPLLSVIIPIYNTVPFLSACVQSVLDQMTVFDYEILLVDDGSADGSFELCDRYEDKHQTIRVIHQQNQGLSMARNIGLRASRGTYILFLDSDDWLKDNQAFKHLAPYLDGKNEVVFFESEKDINSLLNRTAHVLNQIVTADTTAEHIFEALIRLNYPLGCAWNRVLQRQMLINADLWFEAGIYCEDIEWNVKLIRLKPKIALCPYVLHCYRQHGGTITQRYARLAQDFKTIVLRCIKDHELGSEPAVDSFLAFQYSSLLEFVPYLSAEEQKETAAECGILNYAADKKARLCCLLVKGLGFMRACKLLHRYLISKKI